jgi:nucleoside 2-deoxyribosyltransferase
MKSVVLCGSSRFKTQIRKFASELRTKGVVVFVPYLHSGQDEWVALSNEYKNFVALGLTHDHFYKIRIADVVYIYNEGGYAGPSTSMEIGFAVALGKPIYAYSVDEELCRQVLYRECVRSPEDLLTRLC